MSETKVIDIKELKFDEHNFNRHNDDGMSLLEKSIKENGLGRSILLDKDNNIVGGNGVTEKAIELGKTKVRIIETDGTELIAVKRTDLTLDSERGRKMAFADNSVAHANLEWNKEELQKAQDEWGLVPEEWGVEMPDFGLPDDLAVKTVEEDNFEIEDDIEEKVNIGDIWQLGNHRLMCGDSTSADDVARLMNGEQADLWITDPPYNVGYGMQDSAQMSRQNHRTDGLVVLNDRMEDSAFLQFLKDAYSVAFSNMKPGAAFYIWHSGLESYNFIHALKECKQQLRSILIWNKNRLVMGSQDYQWKHEPCLYGWKDGAAHYFVDVRNRTTVWEDGEEIDIDKMKKDEMKKLLHEILDNRVATTVIDCAKPVKSEEHPTMKPVRLFGYQIANSSRPGNIILDTFGGSGTTIVACEQLNRQCRMMELDTYYCDVIIARWEKLTGGKAVRLNE